MLDVLIAGADVIDGTGRPRRRADVGVRAGRIVTVGSTDEPAARTVDASGLVVAPGFVDLHTHYDAQLAWDPTASPSPLHGVTTAIGGNCGFSLAPAGAEHAEYLMKMMARVEGMPLTALQQGLAWDWDGFADWIGRLDGRIGINAGFLVGHSALRRVAMGDDAVGSVARADQVERMVGLLHESLAAGALGFSTSRAPTHNDGAGEPVPSRSADDDEMLALARAVRDHDGTTLEMILAGCINGFTPPEVDLMATMSLAANRPVNWNVLGVSALNPQRTADQLAASTAAAARGATVVALTLPHAMSIRLSFLSGFVLDGLPGWREVMALPVGERIAALRDPAVRRALDAGAHSDEAGMLRGLANWKVLQLTETFAAEYAGWNGRAVGEVAAALGKDPFDALLDVVIADDLRTGISPPTTPMTEADWAVKTEAWRDPRTIVGGSDAGAHLDMMCGAIYSTEVLAGVRRFTGFSLEEAVQQLTDVPARFYGLRDRGRVELGWWADLVVFDPERVGHGPERTRQDLPGGASRLYAEGVGIEHVFVNGIEIVRGGAFTGDTPGAVLRSGKDTETVTVPGRA
ncbi:MAG: amidohydrolase family protein [Acidimicrobiales bacterium]